MVILGIKNLPKKMIQKRNGKTRERKINIKIFFKALNKSHILPTRYFVDLSSEQQKLISNVSNDFFEVKDQKNFQNEFKDTWKINNIFIDKYFSGKNKWFFKKLNF